MIFYQSVFGWISTILTVACLVWCVGLGLFVLIKFIINKVKAKKEQKALITQHEIEKQRKFGYDKRTKKNK